VRWRGRALRGAGVCGARQGAGVERARVCGREAGGVYYGERESRWRVPAPLPRTQPRARPRGRPACPAGADTRECKVASPPRGGPTVKWLRGGRRFSDALGRECFLVRRARRGAGAGGEGGGGGAGGGAFHAKGGELLLISRESLTALAARLARAPRAPGLPGASAADADAEELALRLRPNLLARWVPRSGAAAPGGAAGWEDALAAASLALGGDRAAPLRVVRAARPARAAAPPRCRTAARARALSRGARRPGRASGAPWSTSTRAPSRWRARAAARGEEGGRAQRERKRMRE
jgi:hypothetical protein